MSQNKISQINVLSNCSKLRELYLRRNSIGPDLLSLACLSNLMDLRIVWFDENPCCYNSLYRLFLIRICKGPLERIDTEVITESERKKAFSGDNVNLEDLARKVASICTQLIERPLEKVVLVSTKDRVQEKIQTPPQLSTYIATVTSNVSNIPIAVHEGISSIRNGGLPLPLPLVKKTIVQSSTASSSNIFKAAQLLINELSVTEGGDSMLSLLSESISEARISLKGNGGGIGTGAGASPRPPRSLIL